MQLIKNQKVGSAIADSTANLSVLGIFQLAEEAITELMGDLRIDDVTAKREYNAVWVFARNRTEIYKNIAWNADCSVACFVSKIARLSVCMDVGIKNEAGEICAYSRVEMCALDLESGRIRKVATVGVDEGTVPDMPWVDISFARYDAEGLPEAERVKVRYTNIDFAGHTNNKEYIRFMLNTYSVRELEARPIRAMDVAYIGQSFENDILTVRKGSFQDKDIFAVQKDDKTIVKCEVLRGEGR